MKACVIGYGSIGKRHCQILKEKGVEVLVVSRHSTETSAFYPDFPSCFAKNPDLDYVIIANETSHHKKTLNEVHTLFKGKILVEKPLFNQNTDNDLKDSEKRIFVAYNLRFHPIIQKIKEAIINTKVLSVHVYVGQYLPNWRPGTDYSLSYSAKEELGGGVLRDLSHELDYCHWLFGNWKNLFAIGGKFSELNISSDDTCSVIYSAERSPVVTINLNYLDHLIQREIIINTTEWSLKADLIKGTININNEITQFPVDRNQTYSALHKAMMNNQKDICTYKEGMKIMSMIDEIHKFQKREKKDD